MVGIKKILVLKFCFLTSLFAITENKLKGNIAECVYNNINKISGQVYGEFNLVNGIDHILVKRDYTGKIINCTITDSKYGLSGLAKNRLNIQTGEKNIHQLSQIWINQNLEKLINNDLETSKFDKKIKNKILKARKNGYYKELKALIKNKKCKKRIFGLKFDSLGKINTSYKEAIDIDDKTVKTRKVLGSYKTNYSNKTINPYLNDLSDYDKKVINIVNHCTANEICLKNDGYCKNKIIKKLKRSPKLIKSVILKNSISERNIPKFTEKINPLLQNFTIKKQNNIYSMNDYQKVAKKIDKKAIAVPAIITKDNKIIMSIKNGAYSGLAVLTIDSATSYYDYIKGNIYNSEFERQIINNTINASSVSAVEGLIMFIIPSPHGLIILGAGVGTYILVDKTLESYKNYKEKHFLNADDLTVYGIKMDSILNINNNNIPLNIDNW